MSNIYNIWISVSSLGFLFKILDIKLKNRIELTIKLGDVVLENEDTNFNIWNTFKKYIKGFKSNVFSLIWNDQVLKREGRGDVREDLCARRVLLC